MKTMKQVVFLMLCFITASPIFAQDIIVRRDGTIIQSKVMEISDTEIKYKKISNPDGPLYTLKLSEILSINYQNGEIERFNKTIETVPATIVQQPLSTEPSLIEVETDINNQILLDKYNSSKVKPLKNKAPSTKPITTPFFYKFAFTKNSVLSNKDIEVTFEWNETRIAFNWVEGHRDIKITNKSDETIYVDKAKCFRINLDGSSHFYYNSSKQKSVTNAENTGLNVHLGAGISVGGGKTNATTSTYTDEKILVIPPHSSAFLSTLIAEGKVFITEGEEYFFHLGNNIPWEVKKWAIYDFTEEDTPGSIKYTITYSKQENFQTYSQAKMELFIQQVLGMGYTGGTIDVEYDPTICIVGDSSK